MSDTTGAAKMASDIAGLSSGKADKVTSATNGNFAGLDSNGNLTDSGYNSASFDASGSAAAAESAAKTYADGLIAGLDATKSQTAGADGLALSITETDGKITAISGSIASGTYEEAGAVAAAIGALDATKSQTAGTDGLALSITETDGKITAISGSIAANTYDAYGSASTAESNANSYADSLIAGLDATKSQAAGTDGLALSITETDGKITAISGSIAANTYDAAGSAAAAMTFAEGLLTWIEVSAANN